LASRVDRRLGTSIAFFYGNFVRGVRRTVVDGIEPADRPGESIQMELFEYVYHQILRKDPEWVARDLFRQHYRRHAEAVTRHAYDPNDVGCMLLCTSHQSTLEALIERPLGQGDLLAVANTVIYLGRMRDGNRFRRAMVVAKHRGSACTDQTIPFRIDDDGIVLE
jgi:KaiC/GvpD/RAD55 family RecA-like ATPase